MKGVSETEKIEYVKGLVFSQCSAEAGGWGGADNLHWTPQPHVPKETLSVWGSVPGLTGIY